MAIRGGSTSRNGTRFKFKPGQLIEAAGRDDEGRSQGTLLLEVLSHQGTDPKGDWVTGKYVVASDSHMRWWMMSEGEGRVLAKKGSFHFCEENSQDCQETRKGKGKAMHLEKFREIIEKEVDNQVPGWAFEGSPKKIFEAYLRRATLATQPTGDETDDEGDSGESSDPKGCKERLEKAREELKRLEKREQKKKKKKKAKVRARASPAREKAVKKKKKDVNSQGAVTC